MCVATGKKLFPLMILQILRDDTDDDHHLLQKEIVEKLEKIGSMQNLVGFWIPHI